jgi:hypothetical protein
MHSNVPSPSPKSRGSRVLVAVTLAAAAALAGPASAEELYTFTVGVLGGAGGSLDADPGDDLANTGFQLNLAMVTQARTHVVVRAGQFGLADAGQFGAELFDADLSYVTISGEYRYRHSYYESGMFLGLGGYKLNGFDLGTGEERDETSIGVTVGATGEFAFNRHFSFVAEVAGHYVELDEAQLFATAHAGFSIHF